MFPAFTVFDEADKKKNEQFREEHPNYFPQDKYCDCPRCKGYGYCVYIWDAYGPGKHFKGFCIQCNGYGVVRKDSKDASCVHQYVHQKNLGRCYNREVCTKCGQTIDIDSSD